MHPVWGAAYGGDVRSGVQLTVGPPALQDSPVPTALVPRAITGHTAGPPVGRLARGVRTVSGEVGVQAQTCPPFTPRLDPESRAVSQPLENGICQ